MRNEATKVAPPAALSVVATVAPAFLEEPGCLLPSSIHRVTYVVRNPGPDDSAGFDIVLMLGERPLERHRYPGGLDAGRALASYFRVPSLLAGDGQETLLVRLEGENRALCCAAMVA